MADHYYATEVRWQDESRCAGARFEFVPDDETSRGLKTARTWCDRCPVRAECLAYALVYRLKGYWGGTDTGERTLLHYTRDRVKCPVCKAFQVIRAGRHEICRACGLSWTWSPAQEGEKNDDGGADRGGESRPDRSGEPAQGPGTEPVPA